MSKKNKKQSTSLSQRERIKELTEENLQLRREINSLKSELQNSKRISKQPVRYDSKVEKIFNNQARSERTFSQEKYFSYLIQAIKNAPAFRIYSRINDGVRRFNFLSTTFKIIFFLFSILQSGAIIIISTSALIIALPFTFLISGAGTILTFLGRRQATEKLRPKLYKKNVYVFFPGDKSAVKKGTYFNGFVESFAKRENAVCIVVYPGFFFSKGLRGKKRYFFTSRTDGENLIVVRRRYYYELKNKILSESAESITEIY